MESLSRFETQSDQPAKKKRRRLKQALKDIQQQVEFYFSDSNLHQDKFLLQKTGKQGLNYVPIDLLKDFNCLKELEATCDMIVKAVQRSPLLELDVKKKNIRRKFSLLPASNTDPKTIYIESLPDDATIKWLKDVTSKLGEVKYISLPRYKNSGLIKGYAFIEFARVEEAQRACTILNSPPNNFFPNRSSKPPTTTELNTEINTIDNNSKNSETSNKKLVFEEAPPPKKRLKFDEDSLGTNIYSHKCNHISKTGGTERKISSKYPSQTAQNVKYSCLIENNNDDCHISNNTGGQLIETVKKSKPNDLSSNSLSLGNATECYNPNNILQSDISALISMSRKATTKPKNLDHAKPQILSAVVDVTKKKKKTRKRTRKQNAALKVNWKQPAPKLTVMLKTTWNEAKKLYLREQRTTLGNLKSIMHKNVHPESGAATAFIKRHVALNAQSDDHESTADNSAEVDISGEEISTKNKVPMHCPPTFQPGVIVKINNIFPDVQIDFSASKRINFKCLKTHFSSYGEVAYVDVNSGNNEGFIRYQDSASAQKAILEEQKYNLRLLTGELEESYWDSLLVSRQLKRSRERKRIRGRDKLVARANQLLDKSSSKHIKFNSDFP